jgi:hypothetical protein
VESDHKRREFVVEAVLICVLTTRHRLPRRRRQSHRALVSQASDLLTAVAEEDKAVGPARIILKSRN